MITDILQKPSKEIVRTFYMIDNEEMATLQGLVLGLYIVAEILRLQNSEIDVEDEKDVRTTFTFYLDRYQDQQELTY